MSETSTAAAEETVETVENEPAGLRIPVGTTPVRRGQSGGGQGKKVEAQKIEREARPGWSTAAEAMPKVGDAVYCAAGMGAVIRVHGKTGDGTRLLEIKLDSGVRDSFFAASSNVLVAPPEKLIG